ncbi:cobalamin biosynthesis protein, partial [Fischerella thermalis CCMEE 5328]
MNSVIVLILAAYLDYIIGDPWGWPHPVRVMGWIISRFSKFALKYCHNPLTQRLAGILLGIFLVIGSGIVGYLIIQTTKSLHPLLGIAIEIILLASCFAAKSLRAAAQTVLQLLTLGKIQDARCTLSNYVGRDTE